MRLLRVSVGLMLGLVLATPVQAAVVINEAFPNPSGTDRTEPIEFIELYNTGNELIDLTGYTLQDKVKTFTLSGMTINPLGYLALRKSQTGIGLNNDGDTVTLKDANQVVMDNFSFSDTIEDKSWSRIPDGAGEWTEGTEPSEGSANVTLSPSPTPTPTPTPIPTVSPTPKPSPTPTPTIKASPQVLAATVAAEVEETPAPTTTATPSATPQPEIKKQSKWAWLMIVGGGGLALAALFPFLSKWYHDHSWLRTLLKGGDQQSSGQG